MSAGNHCSQNIYVPDACSLLFSAQLRLAGSTVFERLLNAGSIHVCQSVRDECIRKIQSREVQLDNPGYFKRSIERLVTRIDFNDCKDYLQRYCELKEISDFPSLQNGEKECFALGLYLSNNSRKPITLLTDDIPAIKAFSNILSDLKFGIAKSIPDFIIGLFQTDCSIEETVVKGLLQTYFNLFKQAEERKRLFKDRLGFTCRSLWFNNCAIRCV